MRRQVTGGSLKESREALEIAETDGKPSCLPACCGSLTAAALGGACKVFGEMLLRSCLVCAMQGGCSALWACTRRDAG